MKKLKSFLFLIAACAIVAIFGTSPAWGQQLTVGTGTSGLTYSSQFKDIQKICGKELAMVEYMELSPDGKQKITSNGAVKNAELLLGNKVNGGWVQADILHMMARTQDLGDIKTLLVLHQEALHYIVKSDLVIQSGGVMGFGGTKTPVTDLAQIVGMTVAASGGGAWTAKQVRLETEISHNIIEVGDAKQAILALNDGRAQVALIVGGYPIDYVKTLGKDYRILTINPAVQAKLAKAYVPANVTYANLADGGVSTSMSVQALFVVREYKTPKMVAALAALRSCVLDNLDEIKETIGNHASWRQVKMENQSQSKWPLYQLPAARK